MSTESTKEECWAIQLAYYRAKGIQPPEELDPEAEVVLREILGNEEVDKIKKPVAGVTWDSKKL